MKSEEIILLDKSEEDLEDFLFNTKSIVEVVEAQKSFEGVSNESLFFVDTNDNVIQEQNSVGDAPAWVDEDDIVDLMSANRRKKLRLDKDESIVSSAVYENRLKKHYETQYDPKWARINLEEKPVDTLNTTGILKDTNMALTPEEIKIHRVKDANANEYNESVVSVVKWHESGQVIMTAGLDKTLRLFQVDGVENPKISSLYFKDFPIYNADFMPNRNEMIISGKRKFFYDIDIESGKAIKMLINGRDEVSWLKFKVSPDGKFICFRAQNGEIVVLSGTTKTVVGTMKMNGHVNDFSFTSDGLGLCSVGSDSEIYYWDMRNFRCSYRAIDQGSRNPYCIAMSPNDNYLATGDDSGTVNLYEGNWSSSILDSGVLGKQDLKKCIDNLTTKIQGLEFNHDGELLAAYSETKRNQFKIIHTKSRRVYSNWPTSSTPLGYVRCASFSPSSSYLALGNDKGKVLLYRCLHYDRN